MSTLPNRNQFYNPFPQFNYSYLTICMKQALLDLDKYFTPFVKHPEPL